MTVDWTHFTPWSSLAGGLLIGLAAGLLVLGRGRILGAAGILGGLVDPRPSDIGWRLSLILGLVIAPTILSFAMTVRAPAIEASWPILFVAGLLVGFGTRLGTGCTSGHGICGISRLSPRSFVATGLFMATGFATVFIARHVLS